MAPHPCTSCQHGPRSCQLLRSICIVSPARPQVLVEKCLGRRLCKKCGKNYNIADIYLPASEDGQPEIVMPPLNPPPECMVRRGAVSVHRHCGWCNDVLCSPMSQPEAGLAEEQDSLRVLEQLQPTASSNLLLCPLPGCPQEHMEQRADDTEPVRRVLGQTAEPAVLGQQKD